MRFALTSQHKKLFDQRGYIEFEELLSEQQTIDLHDHVKNTLLRKGKSTTIHRDVWRTNEEIRKVVCSTRLAALASELMDTVPLRLLYDNALCNVQNHQPLVLDDSAFQGIVGGLILCLSSSSENDESILPQKPGSGVYFNSSLSLPIEMSQDKLYLIIVYGKANTVYVFRDKDPFVHELKRYDYVFGDVLDTKTHPIVWRN